MSPPWNLAASPFHVPRTNPAGSETRAEREFVNRTMTEAEVEAIRLAICRGRPFGSEAWTRDTAGRLGVEFSLRSRGGQRRENTYLKPLNRDEE